MRRDSPQKRDLTMRNVSIHDVPPITSEGPYCFSTRCVLVSKLRWRQHADDELLSISGFETLGSEPSREAARGIVSTGRARYGIEVCSPKIGLVKLCVDSFALTALRDQLTKYLVSPSIPQCPFATACEEEEACSHPRLPSPQLYAPVRIRDTESGQRKTRL